MAERTVAWKDREDNSLIGTRVTRLDGVDKASGTAKYSANISREDTLYVKVLTCPHGRAQITKLDIEPARATKGVHAVHVFAETGAELNWDGALIAAVAAERPEIAEDGIRAIAITFKVLEHFVDDDDLEGAVDAERTQKPQEASKGDVDAALREAGTVVHNGYYGVPAISHMCMEPHGSHCEWTSDEDLNVHLSTQNVTGTAGQFAQPLQLVASRVSINCEYIGGGFGSKFQADEWGVACAKMAREAGRPVRFMLDRATELKIAGVRPSGFAKVTIAADKEGRITAWDSHHWGTRGLKGGTIDVNQMPYVFDLENRKRKATGIKTNCGPDRAWRAPHHPQLCAVTCTAIDDIAGKLGMDSYEVFRKNLDKTARPDLYAAQMEVAARLIDWKAKWHAHGKGAGEVRTGLGMGLHTWAGHHHRASCKVQVNPDGTVESFGGTQDLGTGTRTAIGIVLAETFGLPMSAVRVHIGSNKYPQSLASGGSTTIGGVSGPNRRASLEALWQIFDLLAAKYEVDGEKLTARDAAIFLGDRRVCSWKEACGLLSKPLEVQGTGPKDDGLTDQGVGGVQMADVSVDTGTGVVRINKLVAVQDCGLIVDLMTAESQVYGALIMGIAYALTEERIMDNNTGRYINADLVNYKLPRIGDIGELVVEMYQPDNQYERGVIGLGEPPVISTGAAIANAVANAIGVRVPVLPMTPKRVLEALEKGAQA